MSTDFLAHYDGHAIIPDEPLSLPIGEKLRVRIEAAGS
ncbi:MAG TPA: antitoxin family protein [Lacipirellulaceae bacterium]|mgnify:CR=1 FL=1|nr:antitoxin family protein [Lacipirellulaceae bacterium]